MGQNENDDIEFRRDLHILIGAAIEIGGYLQGIKYKEEGKQLIYAEGLGKKIIHHAVTANYLFRSYQLQIEDRVYEPQVDFASIAILVRAAWETYLMMNHIFISTKNADELELRFLCWHLGGYLERADAVPKNEENIKLQEAERKAIVDITRDIQELPIFNKLTKKEKTAALKGDCKLGKYWVELATNAGFKEDFFRLHYKFLCAYAHSSRLSVIQIQQTKDIVGQIQMAKSSLSILMPVLAKFMFEYIDLIPDLTVIAKENKNYQTIVLYKLVAENIDK